MLDGEVGNSTHTEDVGGRRPRAVHPALHRRAVHDRRADRAAGARQDRLRRVVRCVPDAGRRPSCGWERSAEPTCGSADRTPVSRSARTARPRWRWRTSPSSGRCNGSTVLYPADGHAHRQARDGDVRPRRHLLPADHAREDSAACTVPTRSSRSAGARPSRSSDDDLATLVGAGVTLHPVPRGRRPARGRRGPGPRDRLPTRVKPIDAEALRSAIDDTGHLVVVEDHRVEGGLGDAVLDALAATGPFAGRVTKLAVRDMPGSGTPDELRAWAGIDADVDRRSRAGGLGRRDGPLADRARVGRPHPRGERHAAERVRDDLLGRHRPREEEALPEPASVLPKEGQLGLGLDALGEGRPSPGRSRARGTRRRCSPPAGRCPGRGRTTGRSSRRRPASRGAATATSTRSRSRRSRCGGPPRAGSQRTCCARSGSIIAEVSVISTSTVDGSTPPSTIRLRIRSARSGCQNWRGDRLNPISSSHVELAPRHRLIHELPHDPVADQLDQAELLGQRDELVRRHHRPVGLDPPDQGLDTRPSRRCSSSTTGW